MLDTRAEPVFFFLFFFFNILSITKVSYTKVQTYRCNVLQDCADNQDTTTGSLLRKEASASTSMQCAVLKRAWLLPRPVRPVNHINDSGVCFDHKHYQPCRATIA
jgi:hypothetical protein